MIDRLWVLLCIVVALFCASVMCLGMGPVPSEVEANGFGTDGVVPVEEREVEVGSLYVVEPPETALLSSQLMWGVDGRIVPVDWHGDDVTEPDTSMTPEPPRGAITVTPAGPTITLKSLPRSAYDRTLVYSGFLVVRVNVQDLPGHRYLIKDDDNITVDLEPEAGSTVSFPRCYLDALDEALEKRRNERGESVMRTVWPAREVPPHHTVPCDPFVSLPNFVPGAALPLELPPSTVFTPTGDGVQ